MKCLVFEPKGASHHAAHISASNWQKNEFNYFSSLTFFFFQISKQQLQTVKDRFQAFLNGETQIVADEAFINAVQSYYEVSLFFSQ